jgi:hypothetical protein
MVIICLNKIAYVKTSRIGRIHYCPVSSIQLWSTEQQSILFRRERIEAESCVSSVFATIFPHM